MGFSPPPLQPPRLFKLLKELISDLGPSLQERLCQWQGDTLMGPAAFTTSPALTLQSLSELSAVTAMAQTSLCLFLNTGFPKDPVLYQLPLRSLCVQLYSSAEISYFLTSHP